MLSDLQQDWRKTRLKLQEKAGRLLEELGAGEGMGKCLGCRVGGEQRIRVMAACSQMRTRAAPLFHAVLLPFFSVLQNPFGAAQGGGLRNVSAPLQWSSVKGLDKRPPGPPPPPSTTTSVLFLHSKGSFLILRHLL